ncbi:DBH-like monooxygenase protein 1 [Pollicipes pollicipes]|uniref:DBH-like monooxygenase protein 1 n=1 Tax=Pollicipes pollicipes TaxID=41117 RepID=UPI00188533F1|nr:DBH-like monooxygenase protein 1 [Pollicipes pollicipes]
MTGADIVMGWVDGIAHVQMDTTRLIWALHESDPTPGGGPSYHGTRRGVRSLSLDGSGVFRFPAPGESESFVFGNSEVALPEARTYYHCSIKRLPDFGEKVHLIGSRVKLDPVTAPYVHHILMFACTVPAHMHNQFDEYARSHPGSECYR